MKKWWLTVVVGLWWMAGSALAQTPSVWQMALGSYLDRVGDYVAIQSVADVELDTTGLVVYELVLASSDLPVAERLESARRLASPVKFQTGTAYLLTSAQLIGNDGDWIRTVADLERVNFPLNTLKATRYSGSCWRISLYLPVDHFRLPPGSLLVSYDQERNKVIAGSVSTVITAKRAGQPLGEIELLLTGETAPGR